MPTAALAIPRNPKAAAINATTKNITAYRNMRLSFKGIHPGYLRSSVRVALPCYVYFRVQRVMFTIPAIRKPLMEFHVALPMPRRLEKFFRGTHRLDRLAQHVKGLRL